MKSQCNPKEKELCNVDRAENFETRKCCASKVGNATATGRYSKNKEGVDNEERNATCSSNSKQEKKG